MAKKKAKQTDEEEIIEPDEADDLPQRPHKPHHWSDDGLRYHVMIELPDSVAGCRHYGGVFESTSLAKAKEECTARAEKAQKTGVIHDRENWNHECFRHEVKSTGSVGQILEKTAAVPTPKHKRTVKDDPSPTTTPNPIPKHRRTPKP